MKATINRLDRARIAGLISSGGGGSITPEDAATLDHCLLISTSLWVGLADEKLVCAWGLVPPTLMSEQAYLWLYTTDRVKDHEFLFVRNSQRAVEEMLQEYPIITGYTKAGNDRTIRWLRWLGATFGEPGTKGLIIPFTIRKK